MCFHPFHQAVIGLGNGCAGILRGRGESLQTLLVVADQVCEPGIFVSDVMRDLEGQAKREDENDENDDDDDQYQQLIPWHSGLCGIFHHKCRIFLAEKPEKRYK